MKKKQVLKCTAVSAAILLTVFLTVFSTQAWAWGGKGKGHHGGRSQGTAGMQQQGGCAGAMASLTQEQTEQVAAERQAFFCYSV